MTEPFVISNAHLNQEITAAMAVQGDHEAVTGLLMQTASWLKSIGSSQWNELLQGDDKHDIVGGITRKEVFIFRRNEQPVGVVILQPHANAWDRRLWGEHRHETSVYLHRLAIHRDCAGQDLGSVILQWALTGIQFTGKDRIRLDCIADHDKLNSLYLRNGFNYIETTPNGFNTYEKLV